MRTPRDLLIPVLLAACGGGGGGDPSVDGAVAIDAATDAPPPTCDVSGLTAYVPIADSALTVAQILPSMTARGGETINDTLQGTFKRHYLVAPADGRPLRDELFVFLAGSGAEPQNFTWILNVAAAAGYRAVSLAYDNETSVAERCGVAGDPLCGSTNPDCERGLREEMIYGQDRSTCVDVPSADAIEHRLLRLLQYLAENTPASGAAGFLTAGGTAIDWSKMVVGGWSQGGGHAGMLARDHAVARTLYISKGADSALCPTIESDPARCDLDGDGQLTPGNQDELLVPTLWAHDPRATPGARQFAVLHRLEDARFYSPEAFELFGMGAKASARSIDGLGPYPAAYADYGCAQVLTTSAPAHGPACDPNDYHKSVAVDGCLARDGADVPLLAPAFHYALTVPVPVR